jgi:8-oxo-dGTP diphosphatase
MSSDNPPWTAVNSAGYAAPAALAVDVVVLTVRDRSLAALALERAEAAFALPGGFVGEAFALLGGFVGEAFALPGGFVGEAFALPGGFVGDAEEPAQTAARKLREKTGLDRVYLEQLATFARPGRDPRGWIPTVAHLALVPPETEPSDPAARWISALDPPPLAFDHDQILAAAVERVRGKLWWSNIAVGILPREFTLAQARAVYEAIAGTGYDPSTFARDLRATGLVRPTGAQRRETGGRPAALYVFTEQQPAWGAGRRKRVSR